MWWAKIVGPTTGVELYTHMREITLMWVGETQDSKKTARGTQGFDSCK
jgi:hypothetical protein